MAKKQDSRRNVKSKTFNRYPKPGRGFNYLSGTDRDWAKSNRFDTAEYCVGVKDGKKFSGSDDTKLKCGDGRSGFSTRRNGQDETTMEIGMDGQFKKKRSTLVTPRSARCAASRKARRVDGSVCRLISSVEIAQAMRDPKLMSAERRLTRCLGESGKRLNRRERKARGKLIAALRAEVARWK